MSDPWDVPHFPSRGDQNPKETYAGVGLVTTMWELIESDLSKLYSLFIGRFDELSALTEYGEANIFRLRFERLRPLANSYFVATPNQQAEGELDHLADGLLGFSSRRNDVAHGIVINLTGQPYLRGRLTFAFLGEPHYALIPPYYGRRRHGPDGGPAYCYASKDLRALTSQLMELGLAVRALMDGLLPPEMREGPLVAPPEP
jgi:hypothetical protein